jgi:ribosomal protein S18 acetylase RimI-like enzyme
MTIRNVQEADYGNLVRLYKSFFKTHNIFQQPDDKIMSYLKEQSQKNDLIVYDENGSLKGALYLVNFGQNADGSHKLWKFRHFAFENEMIASQLLDEAEKRIKDASQTSKVELTIAETEEGIEFYKSKGYEQEGALSNHYRWGETCYILSKSFSE